MLVNINKTNDKIVGLNSTLTDKTNKYSRRKALDLTSLQDSIKFIVDKEK